MHSTRACKLLVIAIKKIFSVQNRVQDNGYRTINRSDRVHNGRSEIREWFALHCACTHDTYVALHRIRPIMKIRRWWQPPRNRWLLRPTPCSSRASLPRPRHRPRRARHRALALRPLIVTGASCRSKTWVRLPRTSRPSIQCTRRASLARILVATRPTLPKRMGATGMWIWMLLPL